MLKVAQLIITTIVTAAIYDALYVGSECMHTIHTISFNHPQKYTHEEGATIFLIVDLNKLELRRHATLTKLTQIRSVRAGT